MPDESGRAPGRTLRVEAKRRGERGIRQVKVNGRWCWQARVARAGARRNRLCETFEAARQAKSELLAELQQAASQAEAEAAAPATLRQLLEFYALDGATMALNRGFTAPIVMALGGWKTERMMRRYAAVTDQTLRAAAEAVSGTESLSSGASHAAV